MTTEAAKTNRLRPAGFFEQYLHGRVIDIGAGPDLVVPHAEPFDLEHGDAERILAFREAESYDCVHSSHCLEHMSDPPEALRQWWALVKRGGYLVLVVPDEDLYEQGYWPSLFNGDHKASFRLGPARMRMPRSFDVRELLQVLPNARPISVQRQDNGYVRSLRSLGPWFLGRRLFRLEQSRRRFLARWDLLGSEVDRLTRRIAWSVGTPIDQTVGPALAQIEVVACKSLDR